MSETIKYIKFSNDSDRRNDMFTDSEIFTNHDSYQLSGDQYSSGRFEFLPCRLMLDAAVSAACCDSCRCREIGVLVDGYG